MLTNNTFYCAIGEVRKSRQRGNAKALTPRVSYPSSERMAVRNQPSAVSNCLKRDLQDLWDLREWESGLETPPTIARLRTIAVSKCRESGCFCLGVSPLLPKKKESRVKLAPTSTSPYIFIERTTKTRTFMPSKSRLGACCLTILIYTFIMFKGAMRPRHTYIPRL